MQFKVKIIKCDVSRSRSRSKTYLLYKCFVVLLQCKTTARVSVNPGAGAGAGISFLKSYFRSYFRALQISDKIGTSVAQLAAQSQIRSTFINFQHLHTPYLHRHKRKTAFLSFLSANDLISHSARIYFQRSCLVML